MKNLDAPFTILAAVAHPDDIEFVMAGTLLLLADKGCHIHMWNLANGCCGSSQLDPVSTSKVRLQEAKAAAEWIGATYHPPLFRDMEIFYDKPSLARVAAVIRIIKPDIILTHSPSDYMEDHQNTSRLVVSGAFSRGMPNFPTEPAQKSWDKSVAIYHALPHGGEDTLRQPVPAHFHVDIEPVLTRKRHMLACHASQKEWLDQTQGMDAFLDAMEAMGRDAGHQSGRFKIAEGWRQHSHLGLAPRDFTPLQEILSNHIHIKP